MWQVRYGDTMTPELPWNVTYTVLADEIDKLDSTLAGVNVTQRRYVTDTREPWEWTGGYEWIVTFVGMKYDLPHDLVILSNDTFLNGAASEQIFVGTAESPVTFEERNPLLAQVNEVQIIDCVCAPPCTGGVTLSLYDEIIPRITGNFTMAQLKAAIEAIPSVDVIDIQVFSNDSDIICDANGVSSVITFISNPGNVPGLVISNSEPFTLLSETDPGATHFLIRQGDFRLGTHGGMSRDGSRVLLECSGRGVCNRATGECLCYEKWGNSDRIAAHPRIDPGYGPHKDCSNWLEYIADCPLGCLARGLCRGPTFTCECGEPYEGPACERIICPKARAWFDEAVPASQTNTTSGRTGAHLLTDCGGEGFCDRLRGTCKCRRGFTGTSCQRTVCEGTSLAFGQGGSEQFPSGCNGHGTCVSIAKAANSSRDPETGESYVGDELPYEHWDAEKNYGCACTRSAYVGTYHNNIGDFFGHDCKRATCPKGSDPENPVGSYARQRITCGARRGQMVIDLFGTLSVTVPFSARTFGPRPTLVDFFETIPAIREVTVHPAPVVRNYSGNFLNVTEYSEFIFNTTTNFTESNLIRITEIFNGTCPNGTVSDSDYAIGACAQQHILKSAECWPFHVLCGRTDLDEPFVTDITFLSEHGNPPLIKVCCAARTIQS